MEAADDKFNASSQEFIRLRKPTTIPSREHIETIEKRKRMDSPIITTQEDDDNSLENAAVIQQIALTRVKHQAEVDLCFLNVTMTCFFQLMSFLIFI